VVDALVAENRVSYAITTGVGKLADVRIAATRFESAAQSGALTCRRIGEPLSAAETRAMMLLRANSLPRTFRSARGCHRYICEMAESRRNPDGALASSVGASGDLAPLAHLALALIGEGECLDEKGFASSRW